MKLPGEDAQFKPDPGEDHSDLAEESSPERAKGSRKHSKKDPKHSSTPPPPKSVTKPDKKDKSKSTDPSERFKLVLHNPDHPTLELPEKVFDGDTESDGDD